MYTTVFLIQIRIRRRRRRHRQKMEVAVVMIVQLRLPEAVTREEGAPPSTQMSFAFKCSA